MKIRTFLMKSCKSSFYVAESPENGRFLGMREGHKWHVWRMGAGIALIAGLAALGLTLHGIWEVKLLCIIFNYEANYIVKCRLTLVKMVLDGVY